MNYDTEGEHLYFTSNIMSYYHLAWHRLTCLFNIIFLSVFLFLIHFSPSYHILFYSSPPQATPLSLCQQYSLMTSTISYTTVFSHPKGAEATIDIDSLYEGADYSSKVTRARFEDLISIPLIQVCQLSCVLYSDDSMTSMLCVVCKLWCFVRVLYSITLWGCSTPQVVLTNTYWRKTTPTVSTYLHHRSKYNINVWWCSHFTLSAMSVPSPVEVHLRIIVLHMRTPSTVCFVWCVLWAVDCVWSFLSFNLLLCVGP
jgi:hypothetical protein